MKKELLEMIYFEYVYYILLYLIERGYFLFLIIFRCGMVFLYKI